MKRAHILLLTFLFPETWLMKTSGCREPRYMHSNKGRGNFFWPHQFFVFLRERKGANLTGCILNREPECVYQVSKFPHQTSICTNSKSPSFDIGVPGHSSTESETVQSWFSGESAFTFSLFCFFLFFSVLLIEAFYHLFLSRSLGFAERQRLAGRWATQSRSRLRLLTLKEIS